jgi:hypothetical protein
VLQVISGSVIGPRIAFHLASNPEEAYDVIDMSVAERSEHIRLLERKLYRKAVQPKESTTTNASPTPKNRSKGKARVSESSMSIEDWMKARSRKVHG